MNAVKLLCGKKKDMERREDYAVWQLFTLQHAGLGWVEEKEDLVEPGLVWVHRTNLLLPTQQHPINYQGLPYIFLIATVIFYYCNECLSLAETFFRYFGALISTDTFKKIT